MAINMKTISELKGCRFLVPSYQRGYRWTQDEVTALLDDVDEFSTGDKGEKRYCLQPLIVKQREDGAYEVVDGQQRLTTIYIFMKIAEQEIRSATPPFQMEYATREDSAAFLKDLSDDTCDCEDNIDFYHMGRAYQAADRWLDSQEDKSVAIQQLNTKIRRNVFFIWHELPQDDDPIAVFTKVNMGKIPLTNAELIKALLLDQDNFPQDRIDRQLEISIAWDRIEQGLRSDSFWYFLREGEAQDSGTRIDMLFDLLAQEYNARLASPLAEGQRYFSFLVFSTAIEQAEDREQFVKGLWEDVELLYEEFRDWYDDLDKYHVVGYLIAAGNKLADIRQLTQGKRKSEVTAALLAETQKKLGRTTRPDGSLDLDCLSYDIPGDRPYIRRLLLLFNIATLVCKSEKQYRFPFDLYKKERWDIEHIHATADMTDEPDDGLGNLTLLDRLTNRSYQDKPFHEKRQILLTREARGQFVPLCTKNVFLKAYSQELDQMRLWTEEDKADYLEAVAQTLDAFFKGVKL